MPHRVAVGRKSAPPGRKTRDGCTIADLFDRADQLPEVTRIDTGRYWQIAVSHQTFGYLWEPMRPIGLKQTISEPARAGGERPETFEVQFTSGGWIRLGRGPVGGVERAELTFEAWRLTAAAALIDLRGDRMPR